MHSCLSQNYFLGFKCFRGPGHPALQPAHPLQTLSAPLSNVPQCSSQHLSWILEAALQRRKQCKAQEAAVVGLGFFWPSPGAFAEPTWSSTTHWASQSSSGHTAWPLQHQPPCAWPANSFSTHSNLLLSLQQPSQSSVAQAQAPRSPAHLAVRILPHWALQEPRVVSQSFPWPPGFSLCAHHHNFHLVPRFLGARLPSCPVAPFASSHLCHITVGLANSQFDSTVQCSWFHTPLLLFGKGDVSIFFLLIPPHFPFSIPVLFLSVRLTALLSAVFLPSLLSLIPCVHPMCQTPFPS